MIRNRPQARDSTDPSAVLDSRTQASKVLQMFSRVRSDKRKTQPNRVESLRQCSQTPTCSYNAALWSRLDLVRERLVGFRDLDEIRRCHGVVHVPVRVVLQT